MQFFFPRSSRLTERHHYNWVYERPTRIGDGLYLLTWRPRDDGKGPRLGLAVSKKCAKKSVDRQRIKRISREVFRKLQYTLPDVDIIVSCRPKAASVSKQDLNKSMSRLFAKLIVVASNA